MYEDVHLQPNAIEMIIKCTDRYIMGVQMGVDVLGFAACLACEIVQTRPGATDG